MGGSPGSPSTGSFCSFASTTRNTGAIGGVVATRYARTADGPNSVREPGWSSHLTNSRTSAARSVALWADTGPA